MSIAPTYRYLRGYVLDPGFSTRLDTAGINEVVYRIPFERLEPGPTGEYVEVVDFDPATGCWYDPVDLRLEEIASQQGLAPSEGMPQFHQQFVYCVAMKTIRHFEHALGRKVIWYPRWVRKEKGLVPEYIRRLRIHPHGIRDANAYYDPTKRTLMFGYFDAANQALGANFPGGLVFTCLSPDIVAHETTHAILDSIHHRYREDTNPDVAAFHEGFADIVALLQRFTFTKLVEDQLFRSAGSLDEFTVFGELATQFGEALEGHRGALRSMIGEWNDKHQWVPRVPSPADYVTSTEAHDRGAVLVATIFDAFKRVYAFRTRDLFRIASNGAATLPAGTIGHDLVGRLAREASEIAEHLLHICIRALDYCPPVDPSFGDYLRALITADLAIAPEDETGYRLALIEAFRARGILPHSVNTLSVESLQWSRPSLDDQQAEAFAFVAEDLRPYVNDMVATDDRQRVYDIAQDAQSHLHALLTRDAKVFRQNDWESFLNKLGLTAQPVEQLFGNSGRAFKFLTSDGRVAPKGYRPPLEVHTVRPAFRAGREARQIEQVLVTIMQQVRLKVDGQDIVFRGGSSLILSLAALKSDWTGQRKQAKREKHERHLVAEYVVMKNIKSLKRLQTQIAYQTGESGPTPNLDMYADSRARRLNFRLMHRR